MNNLCFHHKIVDLQGRVIQTKLDHLIFYIRTHDTYGVWHKQISKCGPMQKQLKVSR